MCIRCGGLIPQHSRGHETHCSVVGALLWVLSMSRGYLQPQGRSVPRTGFYSSPKRMTTFSSPSEETEASLVAPVLVMFCGSIIGVDDLPYKLDGPATDTLHTLGSLEMGVWGRLTAAQPSTPWSFI